MVILKLVFVGMNLLQMKILQLNCLNSTSAEFDLMSSAAV